MKAHTRIYFKFFGYTIADFISCECCGRQSTDIHHINPRGMGGSKEKDTIDNLMALCRECHIKYGDKKEYKEYLQGIHDKLIAPIKNMGIHYKALETQGTRKTRNKMENKRFILTGKELKERDKKVIAEAAQAYYRRATFPLRGQDHTTEGMKKYILNDTYDVALPEAVEIWDDNQIEIYNGAGVIGTIEETEAWIRGAKFMRDKIFNQLNPSNNE